MIRRLKALLAALVLPLLLAACLFTPGKFESALDIRADRSFTYSYKGEVLAIDLKNLMAKAMAEGMKQAAEKTDEDKSSSDDMPDLTLTPEEKAKRDAEFRELAAKVAKEAGYRTVEYRGEGIFYVDYAISGKLTHNFLFPYNQDAEMILPFIAVELRGKDGVRVKAPGFANQQAGGLGDMGGLASGMNEGLGKGLGIGGASELSGTFTLTTNAEIVSQNNENGAAASGAGKAITWKVSTKTKDAPMAVLRVATM